MKGTAPRTLARSPSEVKTSIKKSWQFPWWCLSIFSFAQSRVENRQGKMPGKHMFTICWSFRWKPQSGLWTKLDSVLQLFYLSPVLTFQSHFPGGMITTLGAEQLYLENSVSMRIQSWLIKQLLIFGCRETSQAGAVPELSNLTSSCGVRQHKEAEPFREQECPLSACKGVQSAFHNDDWS